MIYRRPPDESKLSGFGLRLSDFATAEHVEVYPENAAAVDAFISLRTQWRVGMSGPVGLDYSAIPVTLDLIGIAVDRRRDVFGALQIMERAALNTLRGE